MLADQDCKLRKGDTLSGISKEFSHRKWEASWSESASKSLVSKRKTGLVALRPYKVKLETIQKHVVREVHRSELNRKLPATQALLKDVDRR